MSIKKIKARVNAASPVRDNVKPIDFEFKTWAVDGWAARWESTAAWRHIGSFRASRPLQSIKLSFRAQIWYWLEMWNNYMVHQEKLTILKSIISIIDICLSMLPKLPVFCIAIYLINCRVICNFLKWYIDMVLHSGLLNTATNWSNLLGRIFLTFVISYWSKAF